ncbi:ABC transporter permease [Chryseosolibacter indicus]|uniref:ABC transporter permease n=1 Tax=Chryseosolibacter indicus TaxID=2782351 RepID=A0ABS5VVC9_9BACT|nr:ABC transporter permease [Chryseosolibacter indicus]MBT1704765.1 ABC transporter permease [Chryseosolibacter indicus]
MLLNYLKIAIRSLWRTKAHTIINITGLSLGIVCCLLIALFVVDEFSFDNFHKKADRIFRVYGKERIGGIDQINTVTPFPMGPTLKDNLPEVEAFVRFVKTRSQIKVGDNQFSETVTIVEKEIFDVFDFQLVRGDRKHALDKPSNVILSEAAALKYFGSSDPVNKVISIEQLDTFTEFTVTGVVSVPENSSIEFFLLVPDQNLLKLYSNERLTSWFNIEPETYVLLRPGAEVNKLAAKFPSLFERLLGKEDFQNSHYGAGLQPLKSVYLGDLPQGLAKISNPKYAYVLSAIALLILVVACINFVTLSIGRSLQRAKEVGVRKVVGAARSQLIIQFIGEAVIVTFLSLMLGVVLSIIMLPLFNDLAGKNLHIYFDTSTLVLIGVLLFVIGLIAGSYPAFILSGFKPVSILKGKVQGGSKQNLRRVLVGIQLAFSVFLVTCTLIMRNQLHYLQNKDLGFNKEQLISIQVNVPRGQRLSERVARGFDMAEPLKIAISKIPNVVSVFTASHDFGTGAWTSVGFTDENGIYRTFNLNVVDADYLSAMKMQIVNGRGFIEGNESDKRHGVIVNESFCKMFGWTNPVGQRIPGKDFTNHEIIGVVKDFNYGSLYSKVQPLAIVEDGRIIYSGIENINIDNTPVPKVMVHIAAGATATTLEKIKSTWQNLTNGEEFAFTFADEAIARQYRADANLGKIVTIAAALSILIGSLGLYGLASLAMQGRVKEISVRKVLGATEQSLLILLSKDFIVITIISLLTSIPITIYAMNNWLSGFEYHVNMGWQVFVMAGALSVIIALITISYQTIKTAWTKPVDVLKYE